MPTLLLVIAAVITVVGLTKLRRAVRSHDLPWGALIVWALLLGGGISMWVMSTRIT